MTLVTEVNWQAKYLEQINARLTGLEQGQADLHAKVDRVRDELRAEIRGVRDELRAEIHGVRDELRAEILGVRDELRTETRGLRDDLRAEIREVRHLVVGMFVFVVTAVLGAVIKTVW